MQSKTRLLVLSLVVLLASCASAGKRLSKAAADINATIAEGDVLLSGGDVIEIIFPNKDEWTTAIAVRPDGKASFPFLDDVVVAGLTMGQLDNLLTDLYASILEAPEISLNVSAWGGREVIVMGMVMTPGPIAMPGPRMTLIEAIGRAGGPDRRTALMKQVMLVRYLPETGTRKAWKIDARPSKWNASTPIYLQPLDIIYVPNKPIDSVDIWIDQYIRQLIPLPQFIPGTV